MNDFDFELTKRLDRLRHEGLYRDLRRLSSPQSREVEVNGESLLNFSSNDYLGLADEPMLKEAAIAAIERYGAGAGASRLISGSLAPHDELDLSLADFKGTEAALSFSSGYAAALGAICAIMGKADVIVLDKLVHACIVDAARLSGAKLRVFAHNDLNRLEEILRWADGTSQNPRPRVLVVTESVFSMDGDLASLREIVELKEKHGAWLMLDEAHATGLYGLKCRGRAEEAGVADRIEIQMGTLGKAIGAAGGYICGSRALVDFLINRARSFIFSTAPVPASAAAAVAGLHFVQSSAGKERCRSLWENVRSVIATGIGAASERKVQDAVISDATDSPALPAEVGSRSAIIPILIGEEAEAMAASAALRAQGILLPAIRYPSVARGQARLRLTLTAIHTRPDLLRLATALRALPIKSQTQISNARFASARQT